MRQPTTSPTFVICESTKQENWLTEAKDVFRSAWVRNAKSILMAHRPEANIFYFSCFYGFCKPDQLVMGQSKTLPFLLKPSINTLCSIISSQDIFINTLHKQTIFISVPAQPYQNFFKTYFPLYYDHYLFVSGRNVPRLENFVKNL